jgi:hypothetical protein
MNKIGLSFVCILYAPFFLSMDDTSRSHQSTASIFSVLQSCRSDDEMPGLITPVSDRSELGSNDGALVAKKDIGLRYLIHKRQLDLVRMNRWIIEHDAESQRQDMYRDMDRHIPRLLQNLEGLYHLSLKDTALAAEKKEIARFQFYQVLYKKLEAYNIKELGRNRKRKIDEFCNIM